MKFEWNKMIDPTKILEEVFSYFYEDHLIIPFIDKYQFVRSNSCGLNGTTIPMNPFRPFLTVKIIPFWQRIQYFYG